MYGTGKQALLFILRTGCKFVQHGKLRAAARGYGVMYVSGMC